MFNINPLEMLVLALIFLLLFGPEKLPEIALQLGRFVREIRELSASATSEISRELHRAAEENRELASDIRSIGDEARRLLQSAGDTVQNSVTQAVGGLGVAEALDWNAAPAAVQEPMSAASESEPGPGLQPEPVDPVLAAIGDPQVERGNAGEPADPALDEDPAVAAILADAARQAQRQADGDAASAEART